MGISEDRRGRIQRTGYKIMFPSGEVRVLDRYECFALPECKIKTIGSVYARFHGVRMEGVIGDDNRARMRYALLTSDHLNRGETIISTNKRKVRKTTRGDCYPTNVWLGKLKPLIRSRGLNQ